jgi:hypothetical protein
MADLAARNLLAGLRGERPPASVNADDVLKKKRISWN